LAFQLFSDIALLTVKVLIILKANYFKIIFVAPFGYNFALFILLHVLHFCILIMIEIINIRDESRDLVLGVLTVHSGQHKGDAFMKKNLVFTFLILRVQSDIRKILLILSGS
jgi:hypothetical protein